MKNWALFFPPQTHAVSEAAESIVDRRHPIALPASMSFKVLTECPVIVVLLSQVIVSVFPFLFYCLSFLVVPPCCCWELCVSGRVPSSVLSSILVVSQMLPSVVEDRLDSLLDNMESALSVIFTVPSDVPSPLRSIFAEFVSSEVKVRPDPALLWNEDSTFNVSFVLAVYLQTTSFLTFAFRSLVNSQESKFKDRSLTRREVPHFVVQLLSLCPPEASASRKVPISLSLSCIISWHVISSGTSCFQMFHSCVFCMDVMR